MRGPMVAAEGTRKDHFCADSDRTFSIEGSIIAVRALYREELRSDRVLACNSRQVQHPHRSRLRSMARIRARSGGACPGEGDAGLRKELSDWPAFDVLTLRRVHRRQRPASSRKGMRGLK
jgi:hypothetical protein